MKAMIDTGANRTFISIKALPTFYSKSFINRKQQNAVLADGHTSISVLGTLNLRIIYG